MREVKFRAYLTLSGYDDNQNDKDFYAMATEISVHHGGDIGFSVDHGHAIFEDDVFEQAMDIGTVSEYEGWCLYEGLFELMQYTGLKDKNGVEIYEGDIVNSWYDFDTTGNAEVVFSKGQYTLKGSQWSLAGHLSHYPGEVIGNIYENPELLAKP